ACRPTAIDLSGSSGFHVDLAWSRCEGHSSPLSLCARMEENVLSRLAKDCLPRVQHFYRMRMLALLLLLTGCASNPSLGRPQGHWQDRPALAEDFSSPASAGQQAVDFDFEAASPQQAEELLQRGVELPRASQRTADPRTHRDFVDVRVTAVGFGITAGGYLLYCDGLQLPILVP